MDSPLSASQRLLEGLLIEGDVNKARIRQKYDTLFFVRVLHVLHLTEVL
jgi:hypothetical protein